MGRLVWVLPSLLLVAPRAPASLLSDDFGGAFPGSAWTLSKGGTAFALPDDGRPAPMLALNNHAVVRSQASFPGASLSVKADIELYFVAYAPHGPTPVLSVSDAASGDAVAQVIFDTSALTLSATIGAASSDALPTVTGASQKSTPTSPTSNAWHTVLLNIDASRNATWTVDGKSLLSGALPGSGELRLNLLCGTSTVFFDNVAVSSP